MHALLILICSLCPLLGVLALGFLPVTASAHIGSLVIVALALPALSWYARHVRTDRLARGRFLEAFTANAGRIIAASMRRHRSPLIDPAVFEAVEVDVEGLEPALPKLAVS